MTYQPKDVSHCTYDEKKFKYLNTALSCPDKSSITTSKLDIDQDKYSPSQSGELSTANIINECINETSDACATPTLAPSYDLNEQSSPGCQFDESQLLDLFEGPINEVTITTSTSDIENVNNNDTVSNSLSELNLDHCENLTPDIIENFLKQTIDQFSLKSIENSIREETMSVEIQPPMNLRPRYKSDGTRQIEKSRTKPMVIKLPNLKHVQLDPNQLFLLRLTLITYSKNPSDQIYLHVNKLEYHSDDIQELTDGTVCVPLTADDIAEGKKVLPRLSIVKTKLQAYKPELIPYSLSGNNNGLQKNIDKDESEKLSVKQAKNIFKQFDMKASRIACQLVIKQNESFHLTNITCETDVIKEKDQKSSRNKRSANEIDSDEDESLSKRPSRSKSKSAKRKKRSNC